MLWIAVEALLALVIMLFVVWWTMFAGRKKGEHKAHEARTSGTAPPPEA